MNPLIPVPCNINCPPSPAPPEDGGPIINVFSVDPVIAFINRLPVTLTLPVKLWLSSTLSPNLVDPEANDVVI